MIMTAPDVTRAAKSDHRPELALGALMQEQRQTAGRGGHKTGTTL